MMFRKRLRTMSLAAALVAAAFACAASAQGRLSLSERLARLEAQAQGQGQGQTTVELLNRINELQAEVQSLRGMVEQQNFEIESLKKAQRDRYVDLDSRLSRLEGGPALGLAPAAPAQPSAPATDSSTLQLTTVTGSDPAPSDSAPVELLPESIPQDAPATQVAPTPVVDEKSVYDEAFAALRDGRYAESARRFQAFREQFPDGELADNALYWLGESYYVTQNYRVALETFSELQRRFPGSAKAPDAMLKVGYCHYELYSV